MKTQLLATTEQLVRIPSVADRPEELNNIIEYVERFFKDTPVCIKRYRSGEKPSIVISTQDTLSPDVLLVGHLDVVPASEELFALTQKDGRVYGRGVCDMKSECAVMMHVLKDVSTSQSVPNIGLMLTTDEEIGGEHGVNYLLNTVGYRCRVALVPDGGQAPHEIVSTNKGVLLVRLTAQGKTGHGSRPWLGENAIDALLEAYHRIRSNCFDMLGTETFWGPTCNLGKIVGGAAANQVPDSAVCELDIRLTEEMKLPDVLARLQREAGDHVRVDVLVSGDPIHTDPQNVFVQSYASCARACTESEVEYSKQCGSNDGRFFSALQIPIIVSRPLSGQQHSPDEWLDSDSLVLFYQLYAKAIEQFQQCL